MTPNESFKNALKAENLTEALVIALSKATELKITTSMVSANDYYGKNPQLHPEDCLETKINLLKGEIENKIGENILKSEFSQNLQKLHLEEALEGNKLIQNNLETLEKLFRILANLKQEQLSIQNLEVVSFHLGNQLPPPPPPKITNIPKENITNKNDSVIVTETQSLIPEKSAKKKKNQTQNYEWKTLAESMEESELIQEENQTTNINTEEDWGELVIDEYFEQPEQRKEKSFFKEKSINTDTTLVSSKEISHLITDENLAYLTEENPENLPQEDDKIEHYIMAEDQLNLDTKIISENEISAFIQAENQSILTFDNKHNLEAQKEENDNFRQEKELLNIENDSRKKSEINDFLADEDWGDLIEDTEPILEIKDSEQISFSNSDDDWDEVIEELYEPKNPQKNKD